MKRFLAVMVLLAVCASVVATSVFAAEKKKPRMSTKEVDEQML